MSAKSKNLPYCSIALSFAALLVAFTGSNELVAFDRSKMIVEPWRLLTCHWAHWSADHLFWSGGMFALLSIVCERVSRPDYLRVAVLSALIIPLVLWIADPALQRYGGLSGIDSALFFLTLSHIASNAWSEKQNSVLALSGVIAAGFLAKVGYELTTHTAFFAGTEGGMYPVPLAHLVGAAIGLVPFLNKLWPKSICPDMMNEAKPVHMEGRRP